MSLQGKVYKQRYYLNINNLSLSSQGYFQVTSNVNMSPQGKGFIQRYNRNLNNLSLFRPVLLSGYFQSEHVATGESAQTEILLEH